MKQPCWNTEAREEHCSLELSEVMEISIAVLYNMVATWNMPSLTDKLNFILYTFG